MTDRRRPWSARPPEPPGCAPGQSVNERLDISRRGSLVPVEQERSTISEWPRGSPDDAVIVRLVPGCRHYTPPGGPRVLCSGRRGRASKPSSPRGKDGPPMLDAGRATGSSRALTMPDGSSQTWATAVASPQADTEWQATRVVPIGS